jgi:phage terminase Nu1 subunit (DNA packaging protein)
MEQSHVENPRPGRGGARPGAGRKGKEVEQQVRERIEADGGYLDFSAAKARKETAMAYMAELELKIKTNEYVARSAVQEACASAMAAIAQTLRAIPDNLERKLGVSPEVAQEVGVLLDESMAALADELERMARDGF